MNFASPFSAPRQSLARQYSGSSTLDSCRRHYTHRAASTSGRSDADAAYQNISDTSQWIYPLNDPSRTVHRCLQAMRKSDPVLLRQYLRPSLPERRTEFPLREASDGGVFGNETAWLDPGVRRIAPKHLLRRAEVRSALRIDADRFVETVFCCASTGEEGLFVFELSKLETIPPLSKDALARFVVDRVSRVDVSVHDTPSALHPRYSPEAILRAQLTALQVSDAAYALQYCMDPMHASMQETLKTLNGNLMHFELGPSVLHSERNMWQQVMMRDIKGRPVIKCWHMALTDGSCWAVESIHDLPDV